MPPRTLNLCPTESSYAAKHNASGYLRVELDGGMGRCRKDILNPGTTVDCRWVIRRGHFDYLWAFYRTYVRAMEPFYIDLVLEEYGMVRVLANIIPDTFHLAEKHGTTYTVTAQLEVQAPQYDAQLDIDILDIVDELGAEYQEWVERLWKIINIDYPVTLPFAGNNQI